MTPEPSAANEPRCIHGYTVREDDPTVQECIDRHAQDAANMLDERPRPTVKRLCRRCRPKLYPGDAAANLVIVSPDGTGHWGDAGKTGCGIDATGDEWWWPL